MSNKVKICGITTTDAAIAAQEAGADYIGFVFYPPSPRNLTPKEATKFSSLTTNKVAVVVNASDELLSEIIENLNPDFIQLHGKETLKRAEEIKQKFTLPLIRSAKPNQQPATTQPYNHILIDSSDGKGISFDWENFTAPKAPYFLSGGLSLDNIDEAMRITGASMFDVSSGVERQKGVKDIGLIQEFIKKVKS